MDESGPKIKDMFEQMRKKTIENGGKNEDITSEKLKHILELQIKTVKDSLIKKLK